jgi:hypothetical protein
MLDVLQLQANLDRIGPLHFENGWTHAEFQLVKSRGKYMNLRTPHVREQIKNIPHIQFINSDQDPIVAKENKKNPDVGTRDRRKVTRFS